MILSDFDHLRSHPMVRFKVEEVNGIPVEIISYMIADKEFWENDMALETRGVAFNVITGECLCCPLNKFFNVGERPDTQPDIVKDSFIEVYEKRDGSMVTPVLIDGSIHWKTKKSFYSDVAKLAQSLVPRNVYDLASRCLSQGYTPIFEFTHPDTRIVLDYGKQPHFTLIAVRNNETGEFLSWLYLEVLVAPFEIPTVKKYEKTWEELMHDVEHAVGIEGYVLVLQDGRRVKLKTKWYLELHRTMTELRERDVVEAVLNETVDDMKSLLTSQGKDLAPIEAIEKRVAEEIATLRDQVGHIVWANTDKSVKEVAIEMKGHPLFSLIMSEIRGKEANYSDYWKRNHLQDFSLRCVYNTNF
jgi:T4 RnlA family RNA ligase